jgi:hypothetical protein
MVELGTADIKKLVTLKDRKRAKPRPLHGMRDYYLCIPWLQLRRLRARYRADIPTSLQTGLIQQSHQKSNTSRYYQRKVDSESSWENSCQSILHHTMHAFPCVSHIPPTATNHCSLLLVTESALPVRPIRKPLTTTLMH